MFGIGSKIGLLKIAGALTIIAAVVFYVWHTQTTIEQQAETIGKIEGDLESEKETTETLQQNFKNHRETTRRQLESIQDINKRFDEIRERTSELSQMLARHDLEALADAKPDMIQKRVNEATEDLMEDFSTTSRRINNMLEENESNESEQDD